MAVFTSKINGKSDLFNNNKEDFTKLIKKMEDIHSRAEKVSERRRSKFIERGQLTPRERLSRILDKDEKAINETFTGLKLMLQGFRIYFV